MWGTSVDGQVEGNVSPRSVADYSQNVSKRSAYQNASN